MVQIKTQTMKKIVILSIVCLGSGQLFAQSSEAISKSTEAANVVPASASVYQAKAIAAKGNLTAEQAQKAENIKASQAVTKPTVAKTASVTKIQAAATTPVEISKTTPVVPDVQNIPAAASATAAKKD